MPACPCCSAAGPGLGKLLAGRRRRVREPDKVSVEEELGRHWLWTAKGVESAKGIPGIDAEPKEGDPFTSAQFAAVLAVYPADPMRLAAEGFIKPSEAALKAFFQRWQLQPRNFQVPASLAAAPAMPPAPDGQGVLVNTVLGLVPSRQLGMTLPHEHCFVSSAGLPQAYPEMIPFDEYVIPEAVAALRELREAGGGTIVDCTTFDLGRDVTAMARISKESGIHIIPTTGLWLDPCRSLFSLEPDQMASIFIREATQGIQGTGIRAGIIKCAHETGVTWERGKGFTRMGEMVCRAVARAHKATGLPITTHTEVEEHVGLAQISIFEEEGVDLNRVYIGHCNDSTDLNYLVAMLEKGVWLGLDRTGPGMAEPGVTRPEWEERAQTVKRLIDAGWGRRIMLSHDWMVYLGFAGPKHGAKEHRDQNPLGYTFILKKLIPQVHKLGATREQTDTILYDNPVRFFEGS